MHLITNFLLVLLLSFCKVGMYGFLYILADWLFHLLHWKHFKIDKKCLKLFTFSRYLSFFYWYFSHVEQTSWFRVELHLLHWKHFKIDKKYLKLFKFSRYLSFFYWYFSNVEQTSWLDSLSSKVVTSQFVQQTNPIPILVNISQSKGHQTMNFDQLVDYRRHVFFQKWWRKWGRDTTYRPPSISQKRFP